MIEVKKIEKFEKGELDELASATIDAIQEGIGFGWIRKPPKSKIIEYWKGVILVPNRLLFVGKYKGVISGSIQVVMFSSTNEAAIFRVFIDTHFVATWARGHGLAKLLLEEAQKECKKRNYTHVILDVRETQKRAINLYEQLGFKLWGKLPVYHKLLDGNMVSGNYYFKELKSS